MRFPTPPPPPPAASLGRVVVRGLAALGGLTVLFVVIPIQLVAIGGRPWAWPRAWPGWSRALTLLQRDGIPEAAYPSVMTAVAWVLLAHLAVSALHELWLVLRHRPPRTSATAWTSPPTSVAGAVGALAAPGATVRHLVRAVALLVGLLGPLLHPSPAAGAPSPNHPAVAARSRGAAATVVASTRPGHAVAAPAGPRPRPGPGPGPADRIVTATPERPAVRPEHVAGSVLLATGAAAVLVARRRRRLRALGRDDELPAPDPDLAATEAAVHHGAAPLRLARLDAALRAAATGGSAARPHWVLQAPDGALRVGLSAPPGPPGPPPPPWCATADRAVWVLPGTVTLERLLTVVPPGAGAGAPPCPALAQLGTVTSGPDRGAEVFVDLEAVGVLALDGPPVHTAALARAFVAALALSPLAQQLDVIVVGIDCYGLAHEERVHTVATLGEALALARSLTGTVERGARALGATTWELRARPDADAWEPAVVVAVRQPGALAGASGDGGRAALTAFGPERTDGSPLALVTDHGVPDAPWRLQLGATGCWTLAPLGLELEPCALASDELADVGALLVDASAPARVRTGDRRPPVEARATSAAPGEPFTDAPFRFIVRVLGPTEVVTSEGTVVSFTRGKALELVVWLALHRHRPTRAGARTALWDIDVQSTTFSNVVSDARRTLARAVTPAVGDDWLRRGTGDLLDLHPHVVTDVDLLRARLDASRHRPPPDAIALLRPVLSLVRDLPFSGTTWLWPDGEGLPSSCTHLVTSAATELAECHLAVDDTAGVLWATEHGLRALPGHEELVCLRMRAHARTGDLAGVRREYQSYERIVTNDRFGDGEVAPKVAALRRELLGDRRDQRERNAPAARSAARSSAV